MKYCIYDTQTLQGLRSYSGPPSMLSVQLEPGEAYVEGEYFDHCFVDETTQSVVSPPVGYDPDSTFMVSIDEVKAARITNLQAPITCADGKTFQFARDDKETILGAVKLLLNNPGMTIDWRLLDNSTVAVDAAALAAYYDEMELLQAQRGYTIDQEYVDFKTNGCTKSQLIAWENKYSTGFTV